MGLPCQTSVSMSSATLERRVIVAQPENSETPLSELRSWVTPNRLFFVRNHFDVPEIDRNAWRLRVTGCIERELELDWAAIQNLPTRSVFATMECAGNGRSFLEQETHGVQWGSGVIGHAEWVGYRCGWCWSRRTDGDGARDGLFPARIVEPSPTILKRWRLRAVCRWTRRSTTTRCWLSR